MDWTQRIGERLSRNSRGTRCLRGLDLRVTRGRDFVSTKGLYASIDESTRTRRDVFGGLATIGFRVLPKVQILAWHSGFVGGAIASDTDQAIASVNFSPTPGGIISLSVQF